jgi:DNA-binding response OmpR family regulator
MSKNGQFILVVDDEAPIRRLLRRCFEAENYHVAEAENRAETLQALASQAIDLITLDVNLAGEDGLALAREIRNDSAVPIIMVSGKGDLIDTVLGLEFGADDYIAKPFQLREVLARVKSALRRSQLNHLQAAPNNVVQVTTLKSEYQFGNCILCPRTRDVRAFDGTKGMLTTAEFDLLETFVKHPEQALSRDQIMDHMKGQNWSPNDRTIDNQVARLRKKLMSLGMSDPIKTIRGFGYQFTEPVVRSS